MPQESSKDKNQSELPALPGRAGVQSLDTALRILTVLAGANTGLSLKEFAARCRMQPSKLHRYLQSFVAAGMMMQTRRSGDYDLGKLALEVGLAAIQRIDLVNNTADRLFELVTDTETPVSLSVWSAQGPTIIRWERSPRAINTAYSIGSLLPLLSSATGNVFLAYQPNSVTTPVVVRESNAPMADVMKSIELITLEVRRQGYAISRGGFIPGLTGISAPILNKQEEAIAAVTILTRTDESEATERTLIRKLLTFAASCSVEALK
jgi:DNA-binding IclR family transcriptional regulator